MTFWPVNYQHNGIVTLGRVYRNLSNLYLVDLYSVLLHRRFVERERQILFLKVATYRLASLSHSLSWNLEGRCIFFASLERSSLLLAMAMFDFPAIFLFQRRVVPRSPFLSSWWVFIQDCLHYGSMFYLILYAKKNVRIIRKYHHHSTPCHSVYFRSFSEHGFKMW